MLHIGSWLIDNGDRVYNNNKLRAKSSARNIELWGSRRVLGEQGMSTGLIWGNKGFIYNYGNFDKNFEGTVEFINSEQGRKSVFVNGSREIDTATPRPPWVVLDFVPLLEFELLVRLLYTANVEVSFWISRTKVPGIWRGRLIVLSSSEHRFKTL